MKKKILFHVSVGAAILSLFGLIYNQGLRIEHRLTRVETLVCSITKQPLEMPEQARAGAGKLAVCHNSIKF